MAAKCMQPCKHRILRRLNNQPKMQMELINNKSSLPTPRPFQEGTIPFFKERSCPLPGGDEGVGLFVILISYLSKNLKRKIKI